MIHGNSVLRSRSRWMVKVCLFAKYNVGIVLERLPESNIGV